MDKLLTISIAAYNVADYIEATLDSIVASKYIDQLEIFVIDDGGQDDTLNIAQRYQIRFPNSIFPIHKENGGYGTTVNYSMEHASGKYFKLLDGDDWFDTHELDKLVEKLENISTDVLITPYRQGSDKSSMEKQSFDKLFTGELQNIKDLKFEKGVGMWAICYKTSILRDVNLQLPERTFYTDIYYSIIPFSKAITIQYFDYAIYQYRLGRDGQSVSRESRIKNANMMVTICKNLATFLLNQKYNSNYEYMFYRILVVYRNTIRTFLLMSDLKESAKCVEAIDKEIKSISVELYDAFTKMKSHRKLIYFIALCRKTNYKLFPIIKLLYPKGYSNF